MQLEIPNGLGYGPKHFTYKATMQKLKSMLFYQLALLSTEAATGGVL